MPTSDPRFQLTAPLLLASYPKSGNTWVRVFLSHYLMDAREPLPIDALRFFRHVAHPGVFERLVGFAATDLTHAEVQRLRCRMHAHLDRLMGESPCFKVHDAYYLPDGRPLFPPEAGSVVYLVRDPLDVCVSWDHFFGVDDPSATAAIMAGEPGPEPVTAQPAGTPQLRQYLGSWSTHVAGWTEAPGLHRLVLRYEDIRADPHKAFGAILDLLGLPADPGRLDRAVRASRFEQVRAQEQGKGFKERYHADRAFFRAGTSGDGRRLLPTAVIDRIVRDHGPMMARFGYLD